MGDALLLLDRLQFLGVVALATVGDQDPGIVVTDHLADNEFSVKVDALDEAQLMEGLQKVANRIATGLVLAALIVGAALLMRVETSFRLFGYPGLAILLFLAAAIGGLWLVGTILVNDIRARRRIRGQGRN